MVTAFQRGQAAKRRGLTPLSNPYTGGKNANAWIRGYNSVEIGSDGQTDIPPLLTKRAGGQASAYADRWTVVPDAPRFDDLTKRPTSGVHVDGKATN